MGKTWEAGKRRCSEAIAKSPDVERKEKWDSECDEKHRHRKEEYCDEYDEYNTDVASGATRPHEWNSACDWIQSRHTYSVANRW